MRSCFPSDCQEDPQKYNLEIEEIKDSEVNIDHWPVRDKAWEEVN